MTLAELGSIWVRRNSIAIDYMVQFCGSVFHFKLMNIHCQVHLALSKL